MNEKLLLESNPLVVIPELACSIGLEKAIILQQIYYWIKINEKANRNKKEGYYWTYNTVSNWAKQFPWWSESTVKRHLKELEKENLIITGNFNKAGFDRTKWYRINYNVLYNLPLGQYDLMEEINLTYTIPETNFREYQKNILREQTRYKHDKEFITFSNKKIKNNIFIDVTDEFGKERAQRMFKYVNWYIDTGYPNATGREHQKESPTKRMKFAKKLLVCIDTIFEDCVDEIQDEDNYIYYAMQRNLEFNNEDPSIYYFTTPKVLGYWLEQDKNIGFEFLTMTEYCPVDEHY